MANKVLSNTKISNFYGKNIARPYVVFNESGLVEKDRVDAPRINDALIGACKRRYAYPATYVTWRRVFQHVPE